jgi:hypothetical protein
LGRRFDALMVRDNTPPQLLTISPPGWEQHHLILSNEDRLYSSRWLDLKVRLLLQPPAVSEPGRLPGTSRLTLDALPSPLRAGTTVSLRLTADRPAELRMLDVTGRCVLKSAIATRQSEILLDLRRLRPGVYLARLEGGGSAVARKVVVVR